jgi:hydrogenase nickel incorporation protein HypB
MCGVCGCGKADSKGEHVHVLADGTVVRHAHDAEHAENHTHAHDGEHAHEHEHEHVSADGTKVKHVHGHGHDAGAPHTDEAHAHSHDDDHEHPHEHVLADGTKVTHVHGHEHEDEHAHPHDHEHGDEHHGHSHGHAHADEQARARLIKVEQDILSKNDAQARINRARFEKHHAFAVNLMSSPGSGKTTLLVKTLEALKARAPLAVIEGDQQTSLDADRIRKTGVAAYQVNTGKGCHLDATMIDRALEHLAMPKDGVLFIENVGNLVCPSGFDLGEGKKVVVISVTEGEDKPLKYPDMFAVADLVLVNKVDLLPHLDFDVAKLEEYVKRIKPGVKVLRVSARTGDGFPAWLDWLTKQELRA